MRLTYMHHKHRPSYCLALQLPGWSSSPEFPELVGCTLGPPAQELFWGVLPGRMNPLRRHRKTFIKNRFSGDLITVKAHKKLPKLSPLHSYLPSFFESTKNVCLFFCLLSASRRWSSPFSLSIFWKQITNTWWLQQTSKFKWGVKQSSNFI